MFRGREVTHPERGEAILDRLAEELAELAIVEQRPQQDGRNMTMMLGPSKAVLSGEIASRPTRRRPRPTPTTTAPRPAAPPAPRRRSAAAAARAARRSRAPKPTKERPLGSAEQLAD